MMLTACTFQVKHRGYVFPPDLDTVVADIKTTKQLTREIGSPQVKTIYGDEVWIYYGADENYRGPLALKYDNKTAQLPTKLLCKIRNKCTGDKVILSIKGNTIIDVE